VRHWAAVGLVLGIGAVARSAEAEPGADGRRQAESDPYAQCSRDGCDWLQLSAGYVGPDFGTQVSLEGYRGEPEKFSGTASMWAGGLGLWKSRDSYGIDILSNCFGIAVVRPQTTFRLGAGYIGIIYDRIDDVDAFGILTPLGSAGAELHVGRARIGLLLTGRYRWHFSGNHLGQVLLSVTSRFEPI